MFNDPIRAADNPATTPEPSVTVILQNLVLESAAVHDFLDQLAQLAAQHLSSAGNEVQCGITLVRGRRKTTVASSSRHAQEMDEIQYGLGDGPCLSAARTKQTFLVADTRGEDHRWPEYRAAVAQHGQRSILAVPVPLDGDAGCSLNLYSAVPNTFTITSVDAAEAFAREASAAMRLAVRIASLSETSDGLKTAMESRTTIDLAAGIIMAQNRCSQNAAITILKAASNARNIKLSEVAKTVVASVGEHEPHTHFQR